jgi:hypothetical protein
VFHVDVTGVTFAKKSYSNAPPTLLTHWWSISPQERRFCGVIPKFVLEHLGADGRIILKPFCKQYDRGRGLDWSDSGLRQVTGCCENGNEPSLSFRPDRKRESMITKCSLCSDFRRQHSRYRRIPVSCLKQLKDLHTHTCTYKHTYTHIYTYKHIYTHTNTHIYIYTHTHTHTHKHIYIYTHT